MSVCVQVFTWALFFTSRVLHSCLMKSVPCIKPMSGSVIACIVRFTWFWFWQSTVFHRINGNGFLEDVSVLNGENNHKEGEYIGKHLGSFCLPCDVQLHIAACTRSGRESQ